MRKNFTYLLPIFMALTSTSAMAQNIDTSFLTSFGCVVYDYLTGPVAYWGFLFVIIAALLMGFFSRIEWSTIIVAVIIFAVLQSVSSVVIQQPKAAKVLGTAACLRV